MYLLAFGMPAAPEWIFIGILALVLFGPKKLPELARGLGKALGELQKAKEEFHREITGVPPMPEIQSPEGLQAAHSVLPEITPTPAQPTENGGNLSTTASEKVTQENKVP